MGKLGEIIPPLRVSKTERTAYRTMDERTVNEIVASVVKSMTGAKQSQKGVFQTMSEALAAVDKAYKQYRSYLM